jgi:hypothetical protein
MAVLLLKKKEECGDRVQRKGARMVVRLEISLVRLFPFVNSLRLKALEKHDLGELVEDCKRCCEEDGLGKSAKVRWSCSLGLAGWHAWLGSLSFRLACGSGSKPNRGRRAKGSERKWRREGEGYGGRFHMGGCWTRLPPRLRLPTWIAHVIM